MTYREARVYLDEMSKYGSVLGLDTIRGLLRELRQDTGSGGMFHRQWFPIWSGFR